MSHKQKQYADSSNPLKMGGFPRRKTDEAVDKWKERVMEIDVTDCKHCLENDGNEDCPYFGEPDGCNNRELMGKAIEYDCCIEQKS